MHDYKILLSNLKEYVTQKYARLSLAINELDTEKKSSNKWIKKEILGHLIDSSMNNYQRVIRSLDNPNALFFEYNQDNWVSVQKYESMEAFQILNMWYFLNNHFIALCENITDRSSDNIVFNNKEESNIYVIVEDYFSHMRHHIEQIE